MRTKKIPLAEIKGPVKLVCPMCGHENSYTPGSSYLHCKNCSYVYAWKQKQDLIVETELSREKKII